MSSPSSSGSRRWFTPLVLALVLFCSGLCSLIFQTVWLREFRLVFGGAAPAAAAVLAVFMAGLGFGGAWFGARAERVERPLRFYAWIESGIAVTAALTLLLLKLATAVYVATGGAQALGLFGATAIQIVITALVLGVPCFLIGGTLPVAMKFAQREEDGTRSDTALFYGINVTGALAGAALGTFVLLPELGNYATLLTAVVINAVISLTAGVLSRYTEAREPGRERMSVTSAVAGRGEAGPGSSTPATVSFDAKQALVGAKAPSWFVPTAAFLSGFTFFVAELVWYRMSTPLLGGTVYGFGVVLCVVLLGIGVGGLIYSMLIHRLEPSLGGFALVAALQAIFVLLPYALGDRLSYVAWVLGESVRGFGFAPLVGGWFVIVGALAFFPAVLSGIQFPLLVSLLGRGNAGVGRELGRAYFWNTVGSISGSLIGGFVLIPMLSATVSWVLVGMLVAGMSALAGVLAWRRRGAKARTTWVALAGAAACIVMAWMSLGPTAAWRQVPIGYGRLPNYPRNTLNLEAWQRDTRRLHVMSFDGRDANVAVVAGQEQYAFLTNGKSDGSALGDAPTQVMLGLVGAIVHPRDIERCCVVGLGTGTSGGWLADVPGVRQVDVIEIESRAADIARQFSRVNRRALDNPKVKLIVGDGREVLQTRGATYDLIASEPSNPGRAGVANLYTREFYHSVKQRLAADGVFCQWLQGYEIDAATVRLIVATLCREFAKVEVWNTRDYDLLFVCSPSDVPWDEAKVRARLREPIYLEASTRLWRTNTAEGFLSHCQANSAFTSDLAATITDVNTDDCNTLEFAAARDMGRTFDEPLLELFAAAASRQLDVALVNGTLNLELLALERLDTYSWSNEFTDIVIRHAGPGAESLRRKRELTARFSAGALDEYLAVFGKIAPRSVEEKLVLALATANSGDPRATETAAELEKVLPGSRPFLAAMFAWTRRDLETEVDHLIEAVGTLRRTPWIEQRLVDWLSLRLLDLPNNEGPRHPHLAQKLFFALAAPLPEGSLFETRRNALTMLSLTLGVDERTIAVDSWGPHFPFAGHALVTRLISHAETRHPNAAEARRDLARFVELGGEVLPALRPVADALLQSAPGRETEALREFNAARGVAPPAR